jgi:hypothetical protein
MDPTIQNAMGTCAAKLATAEALRRDPYWPKWDSIRDRVAKKRFGDMRLSLHLRRYWDFNRPRPRRRTALPGRIVGARRTASERSAGGAPLWRGRWPHSGC